jgi:hypothetical protein
MQEVVGSSPIIRLKPQEIRGFHLPNQWGWLSQTFCMHRGALGPGLVSDMAGSCGGSGRSALSARAGGPELERRDPGGNEISHRSRSLESFALTRLVAMPGASKGRTSR